MFEFILAIILLIGGIVGKILISDTKAIKNKIALLSEEAETATESWRKKDALLNKKSMERKLKDQRKYGNICAFVCGVLALILLIASFVVISGRIRSRPFSWRNDSTGNRRKSPRSGSKNHENHTKAFVWIAAVSDTVSRCFYMKVLI